MSTASGKEANDRRTASVLCPDLASNCLGRAYVLARLLQPRFDVTIVGPCSEAEVWEPLRGDSSVRLVPVPLPPRGAPRPEGKRAWKRVAELLSDDLVYVSKPIWSSLHAARAAQRRGATVLLDIDDDEVGILRDRIRAMQPGTRREYIFRFERYYHREPWNVVLGAWAARRVRHRTVSSRFLQRKYGGALVPHARDGTLRAPDEFDQAVARRRLGLQADAKFVIFLGTLRAHKGVEAVIDVVAGLADARVKLLLVGAGSHPYAKAIAEEARQRLGDRVLVHGHVPFEEVPQWLAAADVVLLLQQPGPTGDAQVPAKVFDAMAAGRPVVATALSDLPEILDGCGIVVPPGDVEAARQAVAGLLEVPEAAASMGRAARKRFEERYDLLAARAVVEGVLREAGAV
jgi:glycosyltransferase involved in cell wall biosynthesis